MVKHKNKKRKSSTGRVFILLFILLLALAGWGYRHYRRSRTSPAAPGLERSGSPASMAPGEGGKGEVELYFSSEDGTALVPERREVPQAEDTLDRCRSILEELKKGPRGKQAPLLPVDLEVRSLFLVENTLVVDLQSKVRETAAGAFQEALIWYSVVNSIIMNNKSVNGVHFLVDGQETDSVMGHLDMRGAFSEKLDLVRWN